MESLDSFLEKRLHVTLLEVVAEDVVQLHSDADVLAIFKEVTTILTSSFYNY
jgi:hypothetical protein